MDETTLNREIRLPYEDADALHQAVGAVYEAEFTQMARFAAARLGDAEAGRDAVNDAFVIALGRLGSLRDAGALRHWVWSILLNEVRRSRRLKGFRRSVAWSSDFEQESPPVPEVDDHLRRLIRRLPERQRTILFLKYYGDLTNPAIAELLRVSTGTVAATLHQAQARLKRSMEGHAHD